MRGLHLEGIKQWCFPCLHSTFSGFTKLLCCSLRLKMDKISFTVFITGVLFLSFTSLLNWMVVPGIIDDKIKEQVRLVNGTETWTKWEHIPVPIYLQFYIFNVTNPDQVEQGEKPILEETGPYTYRESRVKSGIKIHAYNGMISYRQNITFYFEPNMSVGCELDKLNIVNLPFVSLAHITNTKLGPGTTNWVMWLLHLASFGGESLIKRNVIVKEFIFDGFDVSLYSKPLNYIRTFFPSLNIQLPSEFQNNKFAIYNGRNGSDEGEFTISSGIENPSNFGKIFSVNGQEELNYWGESENGGNACNQINGSDGSLFPPFVKKENRLYIFNPELCRSFHLTFEKEIEVDGIPGYRYGIPKELLEDPRKNPENQCYCPERDGEPDISKYCLPEGCLRLSNCKHGAPIVLSLPHFLYGDKKLGSNSVGLQPNITKHATFVDIEPNTGLNLRARKRLQFNIEVNKWPQIDGFQNARNMVFPVLWVEEYADLDQNNVEELTTKFVQPMKIFTIGKWCLIGIGSAITASGILLCLVRKKRRKGFKLET